MVRTSEWDADDRALACIGHSQFVGSAARRPAAVGLTRRLRVLSCFLACATAGVFPAEAALPPHAHATGKQPGRTHAAAPSRHKNVSVSKTKRGPHAVASRRASAPAKAAIPVDPPKAKLPGELGLAQQAIGLVRAHKISEASAIANTAERVILPLLAVEPLWLARLSAFVSGCGGFQDPRSRSFLMSGRIRV